VTGNFTFTFTNREHGSETSYNFFEDNGKYSRILVSVIYYCCFEVLQGLGKYYTDNILWIR
jgi:hypothetical protein